MKYVTVEDAKRIDGPAPQGAGGLKCLLIPLLSVAL